MSDLYNRLKLIRERQSQAAAKAGQNGTAPSPAAKAETGPRQPTAALHSPKATGTTMEAESGWQPCADLVWVRRIEVNMPASWWDFCTADLDAAGQAKLAKDLDGHLFIDTETTGLSGGSGTWAFLVGWCRLRPPMAEVTQFFMQDLGGEPALIDAIDRELRQAASLGSYNGASFDLPLLRTRWALSGREFPILPHRDCLHPSRRLWKRLLPSCGMAQIEASILAAGRPEDIAGALVPQLYFDYLRSGAGPDFGQALGGVFRHHACDVVSLAMLDLLLRAIERSPLDRRWQALPAPAARKAAFDGNGLVWPQMPLAGWVPVDPWGLLRLCSPEQARQLAWEQWQGPEPQLWGMVVAYQRRLDRDYAGSANICEQIWLDYGHRPALVAWLKFAEHRAGDPAIWRLAIERIASACNGEAEDSPWLIDLAKRRDRILHKLQRTTNA